MLTAIYLYLKGGTQHQDPGANHFDRRSSEAKARHRLAQPVRLGFRDPDSRPGCLNALSQDRSVIPFKAHNQPLRIAAGDHLSKASEFLVSLRGNGIAASAAFSRGKLEETHDHRTRPDRET